ncbi:MAG TPA: CBS domain-containing protein [Acidimicrobiales bacterium]
MSHTLHAPRALAQRRRQRTKRLLALQAVAESLVSVAGLTGAPVVNQSGAEVGRLLDLVVRWEGEPYPPLTGIVVRVGRRLAWVPADSIDELAQREVVLRSARLDLRDFERRDNEVKLVDDVIDHQMVDVDGVRVFRAADLFLARVGGGYRLAGADVGFGTLLRRLGPARWRARPHPERVIDWAAIQPFSDPGEPVRLSRANNELRRLRPGELADLLEELGRSQRQELIAALDAETAADALEEMESDELVVLLRDAEPEQAAALVAEMEPDEAADALRDLDEETRAELLAAMPSDVAGVLIDLLDYDEETAGGVMTTNILLLEGEASVAEARRRLRERDDVHDIDGVLVVDSEGCLVDDVHMIELFTAEPDQRLRDLTRPPWPVTVTAAEPLDHVVEAFVENRGSSVVVIDDAGRPVGRILADDVVDALLPHERDRRRFAGILS